MSFKIRVGDDPASIAVEIFIDVGGQRGPPEHVCGTLEVTLSGVETFTLRELQAEAVTVARRALSEVERQLRKAAGMPLAQG